MARPGQRWEPTPEQIQQIEEWAAAGVTLQQIADALGLNRSTLREKAKSIPAIGAALKKGVAGANAAVQSALFAKAMAGDTIAQIFWLKARGGWRDSDRDANDRRKVELAEKQAATASEAKNAGPDGLVILPAKDDDPDHPSPST